jgi:hypothetical protein
MSFLIAYRRLSHCISYLINLLKIFLSDIFFILSNILLSNYWLLYYLLLKVNRLLMHNIFISCISCDCLINFLCIHFILAILLRLHFIGSNFFIIFLRAYDLRYLYNLFLKLNIFFRCNIDIFPLYIVINNLLLNNFLKCSWKFCLCFIDLSLSRFILIIHI